MKTQKLTWCVVHIGPRGTVEHKEFFSTRQSARIYIRTWNDIALAANRRLVLQHFV